MSLYGLKILFLASLLAIANGQDFDKNCFGKPFKCVSSLQFLICFDQGDGQTIILNDIPRTCPVGTICSEFDSYPCESVDPWQQTTSTAPTSTADPATTAYNIIQQTESLDSDSEKSTIASTENSFQELTDEIHNSVSAENTELPATVLDSIDVATPADNKEVLIESVSEEIIVENNVNIIEDNASQTDTDSEIVANLDNKEEILGEHEPHKEEEIIEETTNVQEAVHEESDNEVVNEELPLETEVDNVVDTLSSENSEILLNDAAETTPESEQGFSESMSENQEGQESNTIQNESVSNTVEEQNVVETDATETISDLTSSNNIESESVDRDTVVGDDETVIQDSVNQDDQKTTLEMKQAQGSENEELINAENTESYNTNKVDLNDVVADSLETSKDKPDDYEINSNQNALELEQQKEDEQTNLNENEEENIGKEQEITDKINSQLESDSSNSQDHEVTETENQSIDNHLTEEISSKGSIEKVDIESSIEKEVSETVPETITDPKENEENESQNLETITAENHQSNIDEEVGTTVFIESSSQSTLEEASEIIEDDKTTTQSPNSSNDEGENNEYTDNILSASTSNENLSNEATDNHGVQNSSEENVSESLSASSSTESEPSETLESCTLPGPHPYKDDCRKYFICLGSPLGYYRVEATCPPRFAYSERLLRCTRDLSSCGGLECTEAGNFPDPENESRYYWCVKNAFGGYHKYQIQCPKFKKFIPEEGRCDYDLESLILNSQEDENIEEDEESIRKTEKEWLKQEQKHIAKEQKLREKEFKDYQKEEKRQLKELEKEMKREEKLRRKLLAQDEAKDCEENQGSKKLKIPAFQCITEGNFPDPNNCERYYICWFKTPEKLKATHMICPPRHLYDSEKGLCSDDELIKCN